MSAKQSGTSLTQRESMAFAVICVIGAATLALGLALIIKTHYHERAYIFLILGAGGFLGGLAGMIVEGQKGRAVFDYGLIAMGFTGMVVGFNYLISKYGPNPNVRHGYLMIGLSTIAILAGVLGELVLRSRHRFMDILSVLVLGVIGSTGIALLIVGTVYMTVLEHHRQAYFLLVPGVICLVGGVVGGIVVQRRARVGSA